MATEYELDILSRHSTPGLRKNQMTRQAKRDHLASLSVTPREQGEILERMYPKEKDE